MFLHVNLLHLLANLWLLGMFGRNVETALNHGRFLAYYLIAGTVGGLAHVASGPESVIPCLGASGAISGILGSYLAIYPLNKIKVWMGWWLGILEVPAFIVLGIWLLWQCVSAVIALHVGKAGGGVAYVDHIGGFLMGVALIPLITSGQRSVP